MRLIFEADIRFDQAAIAFNVDVVEAVDHDVADCRVFEELFERAQAEDFVEDFVRDAVAFRYCHRCAFVLDQAFDDVGDLAADAFFVQAFELFLGERAEELGVDLGFDFIPAVGTGGGWFGDGS